MLSHYTEFKSNLKLAIPLMIGGLGQVLFSLVDNFMVGNFLGAEKRQKGLLHIFLLVARKQLTIYVYTIF